MTVKLPNLAWIFDESHIPDPHGKGEAAVKFIKALKHPKSTLPGQAFQLDYWQERIVRKIYGDTAEDGTRKIQELFLMVGRGNRKTSLMAACLMLHLVGPERVPMSSVCSIANARDQAGITFREMAGICRATPRIAEVVHIQDSAKKITYRKLNVIYEALSSDAKSAHGRSDVVVFWDEGHCETKFDLIEAAETTLNKGSNTLLLSASTAGVGQLGPFYAKYEQARKIIDGRVDDETFLPILFEAPRDVDFRDEDWLFSTNPGLKHGYPNIKKLRRYIEKCEHSPSERESFKRLHLSVWLDGAANPEWDLAIWDENKGELTLADLENSPAWIGVDLSKRTDLTAVAIAIPLDDDRIFLHVQSFAPDAGIRRRGDVDGAPYPLWREQGYLTACEGDYVNLADIEDYIRDICQRFQVNEIAFDRWHAQDIMASLESTGLPVAEFPQNFATFAKPVVDFEDLMLNRRLMHDGNPLLRWAIGNVVFDVDGAENRKPTKKKSIDRIDPAVAAIIAVGRAAQGSTGRSSYDDAPEDYEFFSV